MNHIFNFFLFSFLGLPIKQLCNILKAGWTLSEGEVTCHEFVKATL